jgi:hypothetical protein
MLGRSKAAGSDEKQEEEEEEAELIIHAVESEVRRLFPIPLHFPLRVA